MTQSITPPELMALDDQVKVSAETSEQPTLMVTYNTGDDKIDPFLLSALNNPRDRLLLLKLDHELERFVNDPTKQRLEFPPMSSYQRLIVHRVAQYFLLDHAAVDVDNLKRAVVLFKSPQSRVPVLRLTDLREEPDAPPQKAVKIMRRTSNNTRNSTAATGPGGERAPSDKTLEERETEYAKARARIFNESPAAAEKAGAATNTNVSNTNNNTNTTTNVSDDADYNETKNDENSNKTDKKDDVSGDDVASTKRTTGSAKGTRRAFTSSLSNPNLLSSDPLPVTHPLYSPSDNLPATHPLYSPAPDSHSSLFSAPSSKALDMGDSGFSITRDLDGKNRIPLQQYQIGQFGSDGLFTGPIDSYLPRFDVGYEFADYPSAQEMAAWGMPHAQNLHPSFYGFPSPAGGGDVGGFPRDDHAGYGEAGKGGSSFYFDFAPTSTKEWSPQSSGTLSLNSPLSANAAPFEPSSHLHAANSAPATPSSSTSGPSTGPNTGPSTAEFGTSSPNGPASPSVINTNNTINTFNTINTYNTINTINTINIINTSQNSSPPSPPPAGTKTESPSPTPTATTPTTPSGSTPSSGTPRLTKAGSGSGPSFAAGTGTGSASSAGGTKAPGKTSPVPSPSSTGPPKSVSPPNTPSTPAAPTTPTSSTTPSGGRPAQKPGSRPLHSIPSPPAPNHAQYSQYHHRNSLSPPKYNPTSSSATPTNVYGALRNTSPPPQPPPTAQQLPPPAQIPMPPPLYRPFPPSPAATYGFDANPWNPYVFPAANSQFSALSHPLASHPHTLVQPHPLTHPHLYPPHPQFLPSQQATFGNAALYPFLGPAPVQKPVASLDYERRPPKSTELFDPKAPQPPKRQNATSQIESGMRNMSIYPPNTSPHTSPLQPHPSQLTTQQGVKKGPPLPNAKAAQQIPPQKPPSLSSSHPPLQKPPPQQPNNNNNNNTLQNQNLNQNPIQNQNQNTPKLPQATNNKQPLLMTSPGPAGAPRLLYDYPQQQGVYVPPDHTPPPAVAHILEIYDLPQQSTPASISTENPIFAVLKRAGASIKVLDSSVFIAIFKNAAAARKALENWESDKMKGEECGYSLRQWAPAFLTGAQSASSVLESEGGLPS